MMLNTDSKALPIAEAVLRILIAANWVLGAGIAALLACTFIDTPGMMKVLGVSDYPDPQTVMTGLQAVAVLGIACIPLNFAVLKPLLAMVRTALEGEPFVAANSRRLQGIGWALLALQMLGLVIGAIGSAISTAEYPVDLDAGLSVSGWLAVILVFVLARVFAEGTRMREDLEGTV